MPTFCVNMNAQSNGDHEVHNLDRNCNRLPALGSRQDLDWHQDSRSAVAAAMATCSRSNGCFYCARECHTT